MECTFLVGNRIGVFKMQQFLEFSKFLFLDLRFVEENRKDGRINGQEQSKAQFGQSFWILLPLSFVRIFLTSFASIFLINHSS